MENLDLLTESYLYDLPAHLIASRPAKKRDQSKLLIFDQANNEIIHTVFKKLPEYLQANDLLVLNESKVFPCRLRGKKSTGGSCEVFLLSLLKINGFYPAMIKTSGKKKEGDEFFFDELIAKIESRSDEGDFLISFNISDAELLQFLENKGNIPIPPYIRDGVADQKDKSDYQTIYAKNTGSVAAPTAGLHFTQEVFGGLDKCNIERAYVNLHVGAGTFKPVSSDIVTDHKMHREHFDIDQGNLDLLNKKRNKIAVGTTSLRVLESCFQNDSFALPQEKSTDIFLYPGKQVQSIEGLLTNFHLPKSTLLMLVSSLLGREKTLELYNEAIKKEYRFFSYGDAMLILRDNYAR